MTREQRQSARIQPFVVRCRVLAEGATGFAAYVTELGLGGARVSSEHEPPAVGTRLVLEVSFGRKLERSRFKAEVKWRRSPGKAGERHAFGVGFTGVTDKERAALAAALAEFQRRAALLA